MSPGGIVATQLGYGYAQDRWEAEKCGHRFARSRCWDTTLIHGHFKVGQSAYRPVGIVSSFKADEIE